MGDASYYQEFDSFDGEMIPPDRRGHTLQEGAGAIADHLQTLLTTLVQGRIRIMWIGYCSSFLLCHQTYFSGYAFHSNL